VRVLLKVLAPGVEHGEEADCRTQTLGVRRDRQQRLGHYAEEDAVDSPGILQRQAVNTTWKYSTGNNSASRSASHWARAAA